MKAFDLAGDTQLNITPPITPKKIILSIIINVKTTAAPIKTRISYLLPYDIAKEDSFKITAIINRLMI